MKIYNKNLSPIKAENFIWIAEYKKNDKHNRLYLPEFEFVNGGFGNVNHNFDEIENDKLSSLGFIGNGFRFYYDTIDGKFYAFESELEATYFDYKTEKEYKFMNNLNAPFNDIVLYKKIADEYDTKTGIQTIATVEYAFGYKTIINGFSINPIFHISVEDETNPFYFTFKIVSPTYLDGEFRLYMDKRQSLVLRTPLNRDLGKTFKINIKKGGQINE